MKRQCIVILILAALACVHDARAAELGASREEAPRIMTTLLPQLRRFLVSESLRWVEKPVLYRMELAGTDPRDAAELYAFSALQWRIGADTQLGIGVPVGLASEPRTSVMLAFKVRF